MSSTSITRDPVAVLRGVLERRHFAEGTALDVSAEPPREQAVRFQELVGVARTDAEALHRSVISLLGAVHAAGLDFYVWLQGNGQRVRILFGVAQPDGERRPYTENILRRALEGHLLGSTFEAVVTTDAARMPTRQLDEKDVSGVILGIPGPQSENLEFCNLDGALEALSGVPFDLVLRCSPVSLSDLDVAEENLALVSGHAHRLARQSVSESDARAFSRAFTNGVSIGESAQTTTNWSTSLTHGTSEVIEGPQQELAGKVAGGVLGAILGGAVGFFAGGPPGVVEGARQGQRLGSQIGSGIAQSALPGKHKSESSTEQRGGAETRGTTVTVSGSETDTLGQTRSQQVSFDVVNRQAGLLEELAEQHLERVRAGRSLGMWRTSVQIAARNPADLHVAGNLLIGSVRGEDSHLEPLRLIPHAQQARQRAIASMRAMTAPRVDGRAHPLIPGAEQPITMLTSRELAHWFPLPSHDLPGIPVREVVHLARGGPRIKPSDRDARHISLGRLVYGGRASSLEPVRIPLSDLASHVFIAGTTGAGKTTTIKQILRELQGPQSPIPFMLLEPAKSEYEDLFLELEKAGKNPIRLELGASSATGHSRPLRFNPFVAPVGIPLGRHVEALKILLRSCFDMQESLPQLLEKVVFDTYRDLGWSDLVTPVTGEMIERHPFPTFASFFEKKATNRNSAVPETRIQRAVREFGYEERVQQNLVAALTVRMESFQRGIKGEVFSRDEMNFADLMRRPCFINLADITEPDIKRFLLASIFLRLYSEREAERRLHVDRPPGVSHVVVLEEAHQFLRQSRGDGPSAALTDQSNLLIADAFAELRAYGQAIIVADQSPGELDASVIRNTNTKIVHRLFQDRDVNAVADSMGLDDVQRTELRRLGRGECVVFSPGVQYPFVCEVEAPK